MTVLVERLVDGLTNGFIYALIALALVVVFRGSGTMNFAQAEMALFTTFFAWWLSGLGVNLWVALLAACLVGFIIGALTERLVIRPAERRGHMPVLLVLLGLFTAFNTLDGLIWGGDIHRMPSLFPNGLDDYVLVAGARVYWSALGAWVFALVLLGFALLLINRSKLGLHMRAVADNPNSAALSGVNVGRVLSLSWGIAATLGAVAGVLVTPLSPSQLSLQTMFPILIYGSAAAVLGGLDSLGGAIVGGIVIGLAQSLITGYVDIIGAQLPQTTALALMALVLVFRPTGLFGSRVQERV